MSGETDSRKIAHVLEDVRSRRAAGESLPDDAVLAAHPDLRSRLAAELHKLTMIQKARQLAGTGAASGPAHDSIPGYEILGEIHRGGQGVVYRAIQISTRRELAVKVMKKGPFVDPYDQMRFEREVQILSALKHPNIVSIRDSGVAAGLSYFVMDYIAGEPLDAHVAERRRDIPGVLRLFVKICDAVSAAQLHGIIHRDLKPGNIRIDQRGEPHVLDFGLAKVRLPSGAVDPETRPMVTIPGQFIGSLPWASPEQAEGASGDVDLRTDVYSLGVVLYQALTGCFPYPVSGNLRDVLDNIQHAAPIRPSAIRREIDDEVETMLLKCVQKDRERRYQSAEDLSRDLKRYLSGEPIDAKRDSRLYVLRKQLTRYRYAVFAILAVMLSLIAGIVSTTWRAQRTGTDARALAELEGRLQQRADRETKSDVP